MMKAMACALLFLGSNVLLGAVNDQTGVSVPLKLYPAEECTSRGGNTTVRFGVILPQQALPSTDRLQVSLEGKTVPARVVATTYWQDMAAQKSTGFIRSATVYLLKTPGWRDGQTAEITVSSIPVTQTLPAETAATCQYLAATPANYLAGLLIRTETIPLHSNKQLDWFDTAYAGYARTATNDLPAVVKKSNHINFPTEHEPWLYDRAMTLYGLYFRSGDIHWLRQAHAATRWYAQHINTRGMLQIESGKEQDLKYSYGQSLLVNYMLTGEPQLVQKIESVAAAAEKWNPVYKADTSFWTERHQTYALLAALTAWETTGKSQHALRVKEIIKATLQQQKTPVAGWQADGALLHTMISHEGSGSSKPVGSPWMSALLAEAIWRYYLLSNDETVLPFFSELGDWVVTYGLYDAPASEPELKGQILSWYLASRHYQYSDGGAWVDIEHACDIAALLGRSILSKRKLGQDASKAKSTFVKTVNTCQFVLNYWHRPGGVQKQGQPEWRLRPPRKFNWWFGTTLDLPKMHQDIMATP